MDRREMATQLKALAAHNGWKKIYCREDKLKETLRANSFDEWSKIELKDCDAAVTTCELLVARTGAYQLLEERREHETYA